MLIRKRYLDDAENSSNLNSVETPTCMKCVGLFPLNQLYSDITGLILSCCVLSCFVVPAFGHIIRALQRHSVEMREFYVLPTNSFKEVQ